MFAGVAKSIFGSSNDRYVRGLGKYVDAVNALEGQISALSDDELRGADGAVSASGWPMAKSSTTCFPRPSRRCAKRPSGRSASAITTSS